MKLHDKTIALHKLFMWIALSINSFITCFSIYIHTDETRFLILAMISFVLIAGYGLDTVSYDILIKDFEKLALIIEYLFMLMLSSCMVYYLFTVSCTIGAIILIIFILVECMIVPLISYRYRIINKIKAYMKTRNAKKQK